MRRPVCLSLKERRDFALACGQLSDAELFSQELIAELGSDLKTHRERIQEAYFSMCSILELQGRDGRSFRMLAEALADLD